MSSSITDTIKNRRTIHKFRTDEIPERKLIEGAIEHSVWAPNHHLTQPWRFHLIGAETAERICQLNAEIVTEKEGAKVAKVRLRRWREIPGWLLLSCDKSDDETQRLEDYATCCCVAQNLSLILWEIGVGMKWTTGVVTRDPRFFDIVRLDSQQSSIVGMFWYGFPEETPQATRPVLNEFLSILP